MRRLPAPETLILPEMQNLERDFETQDLMINMGPQHPSTHGVLRLVLTIDGEVVTEVVPYIGYMHRGAEKLHIAVLHVTPVGA